MNALVLLTLMRTPVHGGEESRVSLRAISLRLASQPSAVPGTLGQLTWQETVVRSARHDVADVNAQHDFANVTEVGVQLAEGAATTAFKTQRTDSGRFWHGTEAKSGSVANLLISSGGRLVGSVTTAGTIYSIKTLPSGEVLLSARNASAFKDDPDPEDTPGAAPPGRRKMTNVDDGTVIDLLVLYTRAAMCADAGYSYETCPDPVDSPSVKETIEDRIELALEESNAALDNSGITSAELRFRIVHVYCEPSYVETSFSSTLSHLRNDGDGFMDDVHTRRDTHGADLVAAIISYDAYCGMANMFNGADSRGFSISHYDCATGYFSFLHEIGHNMGADHDRADVGLPATGDGYGYGWQDPDDAFRSIMAYNCPTNCPRVQWLSNVWTTYSGKIIGDQHNMVAHTFLDNKLAVANFRDSLDSPAPPPCTTTGGSAPEGSTCVFPFTYDGATYSECTTIDNDNTPWCSIEAIYSTLWGNCVCIPPASPSAPPPSASPPPPSASPPPLPHCATISSKKKCKKDEACRWKNRQCEVGCSALTKKKKCKKDKACRWKNRQCEVGCSAHSTRKKCKGVKGCKWKSNKCKDA